MKTQSARWRLISSVLVAAGLAASTGCHTGPTIVDRVREQAARHPQMMTADVYKLVQQAAFGNEHLITDEAEARKYLADEFESVVADDSEPLIDPISPDGSVVRINLRPFKKRGLDVTKLGDVMIESSKRFKPNREAFERWWKEVADAAARHDGLPFEAAFLRSFASARMAQDYPAVHHTEMYTAHYHPAYRVVLREIYLTTFAP